MSRPTTTFSHRMRNGVLYQVTPCVEMAGAHTVEYFRQQLSDGMDRLSSESRWQRFAGPVNRLTEDELDYLSQIDGINSVAWCAAICAQGHERGVGLARYFRDDEQATVAEFAVTILDEFQGQGVGRVLMRQLMASARDNGIELLRSEVLSGNERMLALGRELGGQVLAADSGLSLLQIAL